MKVPLKKFSNEYISWMAVFMVFTFLAGLGSLICTVWLYVTNKEIHGILFQLWVAIPVIVVAFLGFIWLCVRRRPVACIVAFLGILTVVSCGFGAFSGGYMYFEHDYHVVRSDLSNNKCVIENGFCACKSVKKMPIQEKKCDDVKLVVNLIIGEISFAAFACLFTFISVLFAMRPTGCSRA